MFAAGTSEGSAGTAGDPEGGARRPRCHMCGKCYGSREALNNHMTLHKGLTNCWICGKCFATTSARNKHVRVVHGIGHLAK
ncbi:gastrula zinc finger protein XlCGF16.1-like [Pollicipes pollicipes]|nr:gastrula zinc finger protein XlCGF16.1-like [Pollicipes pollicipes]